MMIDLKYFSTFVGCKAITGLTTNMSSYSRIMNQNCKGFLGRDKVVFRSTTVGNEQLTVNNAQLKAWTRNGMLHISGLVVGQTWRVYNITGTLVYQAVADSGKAEVILPVRGVYILTNGITTVKIAN